jgi:hypothetical protein
MQQMESLQLENTRLEQVKILKRQPHMKLTIWIGESADFLRISASA